jgi:8-oxo-dGTP diphosphatase
LYTYEYPRPSVAVDIAIFRPVGEEYQILLIQRAQAPYKGQFALPGGFIEMNESLEEAALRELFEETGVANLHLTQIQTFSDPDRDPRGRVISTCFGCVLDAGERIQIEAGDDAADADWFGLADLPPLAFDHSIVIQAAISKLLQPG